MNRKRKSRKQAPEYPATAEELEFEIELLDARIKDIWDELESISAKELTEELLSVRNARRKLVNKERELQFRWEQDTRTRSRPSRNIGREGRKNKGRSKR